MEDKPICFGSREYSFASSICKQCRYLDECLKLAEINLNPFKVKTDK